MNKNLGIILVLIGLVIVIVVGGFLVMQMTANNNAKTGIDTEPNGNTQPNIPATNMPSSSFKTYNVEIKNFAFSPSSLTIKKGDSVIWTNQDSVGHTTTSDSGAELDSELLSKGESYSHTFNSAGVYDYHCTPHPSMKGKIIVE